MEVILDNIAKEKLLKSTDKEGGGFQSFLKKLQDNFNPETSILTYDEKDLEQMIRYSQYHTGGGFEGRLKEIIRCINEQSKL
ncbi:hypothetical protein CK565_05865 [Campylobacter lari]|nr:hypothetical protein [Campylobacter lari]EAK5578149.1 hypothetical protein [Campylobacter lari]